MKLVFLGLAVGLLLTAIGVATGAPSKAEEQIPHGDDFYIDTGGGMLPESAYDEYVLNGLKRTTQPVAEVYYSAGAPPSATSAAISAGVLEWNSVTPNLQFTLSTAAGAPTSTLCGGYITTPLPSGTNGENSIIWADITVGAIGIACWNTGADECDIVIDAPWASTATSEAIRTVLLHEVGHCAGLGHSDVSAAVMYYAYTQPKHLHADDIAGICAIYGCIATPTATPNTPTPTPTPTPTSTPTPEPKGCAKRVWNPTAVVHCKFIPQVARD